MRVLFAIIIFCAVIGVSHAQDFGQGSYDPGASPRAHFLSSQMRSIDEAAYDPYADNFENFERFQTREDDPFLRSRDTQTLPLKGYRLPDRIQPQSRLEAYYQERTGQALTQFGYDMFHPQEQIMRPQLARPLLGMQDDYVIGVGDALVITFLGERSDRELYRVNQDGQIIIPDLPPFTAAGKTLRAFKEELNASLTSIYAQTKAFISLDRVMNITVSVIGEVSRPGRYDVAPGASLLDILNEAGGIKKSGSLRSIKHMRGSQMAEIDLYDLLLTDHAAMAKTIRDGDRILVPHIGPTLAITGEVQRPGIYELSGHVLADPKLGLDRALDYAGGLISQGRHRYLRNALMPDGTEVTVELQPGLRDRDILGKGDVLRIDRQVAQKRRGVMLSGAVRHEGLHSLEQAPSLSRLLMNKGLLKRDVYPFLGVVKRFDPRSLSRQMLAFSPKKIIEGGPDMPLMDQDEVILLSFEQVQEIFSPQDMSMGEKQKPVIHDAEAEKPLDPVLIRFVKDYAVSVEGAVMQPGAYPVAEKTALQDLLDYSGGVQFDADVSRIEVTRLLEKEMPDGKRKPAGISSRIWVNLEQQDGAEIYLGPKDSIRVNQSFAELESGERKVRITGEVLYPGYYDLARGETLLDLMNRAGGLTDQAYPEGAIFSRNSERRREAQEFKNQAMEIERSVAALLSGEEKTDPAQIAFLKTTVTKLEGINPTGRITVEADPAVLKSRPALDILLEAEDHIHIPKRSITVRVAGEVLSPAVLQFETRKEAFEYIREAGGLTRHADKGRAYVIFPDGSAKPLNLGRFQTGNDVIIPPMSTIYVPRDPKPFDFIQTTRDFTQILTNLAITGIFLDDISED